MELIVYLILLAANGLVVGAFARLALPGRDPLSIPATIGIGLAGSFLGGLLMLALFGRGAGSWLVSLVIATLIVYAVRRSRGGDLTRPGGRRTRA